MEQIKPFEFIEEYDKMTLDKLAKLTEEEYHKYRAYCIEKQKHTKKGKKWVVITAFVI